MRAPTGFILYEGPSLLDGSPIVAIALTQSDNRKTGNMVQTYILRADQHPIEAARSGADSAICGNCKHRPSTGGACYVTLAHGPSAVYGAFKRGNYPLAADAGLDMSAIHQALDEGRTLAHSRALIRELGAGRMVRLGTYGDPAAVPAYIWEALVSEAQGRTGYTHQWQYPATEIDQAMRLKALVMASVDTPAEAQKAQREGWRTFRIRLADEPLMAREFVCPASDEAGKRLTCAECGACDGAQRGARANPVIYAHGAKARRFIAIRSA